MPLIKPYLIELFLHEYRFKQALRYAEFAYKKSLQAQEQGHNQDNLHKRNTNVLIYVKRRLGMCARKLGKLKEATKIFRDVSFFF
jgi:hypothetical protein